MYGSSVEDYITTVRWYIYNIICSIEAHDRDNPTVNDDSSSGGGIPLTPNLTKSALVSLGITLNFIENWLK